MTKTFIKWAGGKTDLAPVIGSLMPKDMDKRFYMEPFCGSAAMFFWMCSNGLRPHNAVLNDQLHVLASAFVEVQKNTDRFIGRLAMLEDQYLSRDDRAAVYYEWREKINDPLVGDSEKAALFVAINKTCFNGLWRVSKKGKFNVPHGRMANPTICNQKVIRECAEELRSATIWNVDMIRAMNPHTMMEKSTLKKAPVFYFDPPYMPTGVGKNFTAYSGSFGEEEHHRLAEMALRLDIMGAVVILSNSDTPFVRKLYKGWDIKSVSVKRSISSKSTTRAPVGEVLILGKNRS